MAYQLLATAPSLERLGKMINAYFYSQKKLIDTGNGVYEVHGAKGNMPSYRVVKKGRRYRFEQK